MSQVLTLTLIVTSVFRMIIENEGFTFDAHVVEKASNLAISRAVPVHFFPHLYYSTITSFYHIWTRERAKYETVLHCKTEQIRTELEFSINEIVFNTIKSPRI